MIERRRTPRRRVCLGGRIQAAAFLPEIECQVRDVSLDGARIRVTEAAIVPVCFDLVIPCRSETRRAFVAWRSGTTIGLGFEETRASSAPEAVAERLAASESEVARLRAALLSGNSPEAGGVH